MSLKNTLYLLILLISLFVSRNIMAQTGEEEYQKAITSADKYFSAADYINAKASYQYALNAKPGDEYAQQKLQESIQMIKVQLELNQRYTLKILQADELFKQKKYDESRKVYQESLTILAGDTYATEKIQMIDSIIADNQKKETEYQALLKQGNDFFTGKNYKGALEAYQKALVIKPGDANLKSKVSETEVLLSNELSILGEYEIAMQQAEQFVARKSYDNAILQLETAIKLKPQEAAPKKRLEEVKSLKASQDAYDAIIAEADNLYINKNFEAAKIKYKEALSIDPNDTYVKNILERIDIAITESEELIESGYLMSISKADQYFSQEQYDKALAEYQKALGMKPGERYAQEKIAEVNTLLNFQKAQEEAYQKTISKADKLYKEASYEEALREYKKAKELKPHEQYPEVKIDEINDILNQLMTKREQYTAVVTGADKLFFADDYEESRDQYRKALEMFPDEQYPVDQITMINEILGRRDTYIKSITNADMLLAEKKYNEAALEYRNAIKVSPDDKYAQQKIFEITVIQDAEIKTQKLEMDYLDLLDRADSSYIAGDLEKSVEFYTEAQVLKPKESYPKERITQIEGLMAEKIKQKEEDSKYNGLIAQADKYKLAKEYNGALALYQDALELKPGEAYPVSQVADIQKILDAEARAEADNAKYQQFITEADQYFENKNYQSALYTYQSALNLKNNEKYPQDQINRLKLLLEEQQKLAKLKEDYDNSIVQADELFNAGNYQGSITLYQKAAELDPEQGYPKERIALANAKISETLAELARSEELEKQYNELIKAGDLSLSASKYDEATNSYKSALELKPGEAYPEGKIEEIKKTKEEIALKEAQDKQYSELVAQGDLAFDSKNFQNALESYESAIAVKPGSEHPIRRIEEIKGIFAENERKLEQEKLYDELIKSGDLALSALKYDEAARSFQSALEIKPGEAYPSGKIQEIQKAKEEIAKKEALERGYADLIAKGDIAFTSKNYSDALTSYRSAIELKPGEEYPNQKISEINAIQVELEKEMAIRKKYEEAVAYGDKHLLNKDYGNALSEYKVANSIKPNETYPLDKITEINATLAEIAKQKEIDSKYNKAIQDGDRLLSEENFSEAITAFETARGLKENELYPVTQIQNIQQRLANMEQESQKAYDEAITKADSYFGTSQYEMAKINYETAIKIKPNELYPLEKLKETNEILSRQRQIIQESYDKSIADADKFYVGKIYDEALEAYRIAAQIKVNEQYPQEMIRRILKLMSDRAVADINKEPLVIKDNTTHKFDFIPVRVQDRKSNYIYFKARNMSDKEHKIIVSFGKDGAKNGGFVVKVPIGADIHDFIIRVSSQYKWFSDDNNWLSMIPQGGDIEVSLVQISFAD